MSSVSDESFEKGLTAIDVGTTELESTSRTVETARMIYTEAAEEDAINFVGRGARPVAAAAILLACRKTGDVQTASEISAAVPANVGASQIHSIAQSLISELNLGLLVADPEDYIDRVSVEVGASDEVTQLAKDVLEEIRDSYEPLGEAPRTLAATTFYLLALHPDMSARYTQVELADAADVTPLTIRNTYKKYSDVMTQPPIPERIEQIP